MKRPGWLYVCLALLTALPMTDSATAGPRSVDDDRPVTESDVKKIREEIEDLEDRLEKAERHAGLDRINFSGDYRFEAHMIDASVPDHFDGMVLQNSMVKTMFYYGATGMFPASMDDVQNLIAANYGDWLYFTDNLTFDQLKQMMAMFPPEQQQTLFAMLMPNAYVPGYEADNSILYTNRLRLRLQAEVAENVKFDGRLSMYKVFGDSTGVQVFNGQANTFNIDGTTTGVPNSDIVRVERAYFTWSDIAGKPIYLSIGRRPSTSGAPLHFRQDEPRGGTPLGSLIDYQFDGITFGWHLTDRSTVRLCYGVGYESGFGNGSLVKLPADRLDDTHLFGLNWDVFDSERRYLQTTLVRAFNVTDGFNGLIVLPVDPLTGNAIAAPVVLRFTPSSNLGDMNMASAVFMGKDGRFDWFASANYMSSSPEAVTTPFGGLFSDPFEEPGDQNGHMFYLGARYNFANDKTKVGFEYNHGSKYWFNFAAAEDDVIAPKTATRGDVFEIYMTHRIHKRFIFKLDYIDYRYNYSGSGWHMGAPKKLDEMPLLGFPTYDKAKKFSTSFIARW